MMQQTPLSKTDLIRYFQEYIIKIVEIILQARVLPNNRTPRHNVSFNLHFPERLLTPREEIQTKHADFFTGARSFVVELYRNNSSDDGAEGDTAETVQEVWMFHYEPAGPDAPRGQLVERKNQILVKKLSTTLRAAMTFVRVLPVPFGNVSSASNGQHPEYRMRVVEGQHKAESHLKNLEFSTLVCSAGALKVSVGYLPTASTPSSPDPYRRVSHGPLATTPEEPAPFHMDECYLSGALEHPQFGAMRRSIGGGSSAGHKSPIPAMVSLDTSATASHISLPFCPSPRGGSVGGNSQILTPSGMFSTVAAAASARGLSPYDAAVVNDPMNNTAGLGNVFGSSSSVHMSATGTPTAAGAFAMGHSAGSADDSTQQLADLEERSLTRPKCDLADVWGGASIHSDDGMFGSGSAGGSKPREPRGDAGTGEICLLGMSDDDEQSRSAGSAGRSASPDLDDEPQERIVQSTFLSQEGGGAFVCDKASAHQWLASENDGAGGTDAFKTPQPTISSPSFGTDRQLSF